MENIDTEYELALAEERLILEATELIEELLEHQGINRKELADRLGKSKGHVSQLLSGERNLTLKTLATLAHSLNHRLHLAAQPNSEPVSKWYERARRRSDHQISADAFADREAKVWIGGVWNFTSADIQRDLVLVETKSYSHRDCPRNHQMSKVENAPASGWFSAQTPVGTQIKADEPELCAS